MAYLGGLKKSSPVPGEGAVMRMSFPLEMRNAVILPSRENSKVTRLLNVILGSPEEVGSLFMTFLGSNTAKTVSSFW